MTHRGRGPGCSPCCAVVGTGLAVVSGAAGWDTAHRLLAALALPPLVGLRRPRLDLGAAAAARPRSPSLVALRPRRAADRAGRPPGRRRARLRRDLACSLPRRSAAIRGPGGDSRDYVTLTKPRVMSLLLLTGGAAVFVGAAGVPPWDVFVVTMVGLALACGGAAALNHYLDRDIDKLMGERTAGRPVASGRIAPERALEFGIALSALSFVLLDSLVNLPTALLALAGNLFYVLVYTRWLKRSTPQNIVIGGAAGRRAAARRLRGHGRASRLGRARDVRDRLPLDAAALLGARADDPRPLRERATCRCCPSCAATARRRGRSRGTRSRSWRRRSSRSRSASSGSSTACRRSCSARCSRWMAFALWRADDAPACGEALPLLDALPGAALRRDGRRRRSSDVHAPARPDARRGRADPGARRARTCGCR